MDPATAFQVACGAIQLVEVGLKLSREAASIFKSTSGLSDANERIRREVLGLEAVLFDAQSTGSSRTAHPAIERVPRSLEDAVTSVMRDAQKTATTLVQELEYVRIDQSRNRLSRALQTVNALSKKKKLASLQRELEQLEVRLERFVILESRQLAKDLVSGSLLGFEDLRLSDQKIVEAIASHDARLSEVIASTHEDTVQAIRADGNVTRQHLAHLHRFNENQRHIVRRQDRIKTYAFPGMFDRVQQIEPASYATCRWILEQPDGKPWSSFIDWLSSSDPIYWIRGKAASGKSTLMRYIWDECAETVQKHLMMWSRDRQPICVAVFFWGLGSVMQRSHFGLMRSLIYQILQKSSPQVVDLWMKSWNPDKGLITPSASLKALSDLLRQSEEVFCIFIDGLDEYEDAKVDKYMELMDNIFDLVSCLDGRLKVCLSSRSLPYFEDRLQGKPNLRLHDFNRDDMVRVIKGTLRDSATPAVIGKLIVKANGVFLWIKFAMRELQVANINGDTEEEIQKRLEELPPDLEDLYSHMLARVDRIYHGKTAQCLALALKTSLNSRLYLSEMVFSIESDYADADEIWTWEKLAILHKKFEAFEKLVQIHTAGLLEVCEDGRLTSIRFDVPSAGNNLEDSTRRPKEIFDMAMHFHSIIVTPIHRTVGEFLDKPAQTHLMVKCDSQTAYKMRLKGAVTDFAALTQLTTLAKLSGQEVLGFHSRRFHQTLDIAREASEYGVEIDTMVSKLYLIIEQAMCPGLYSSEKPHAAEFVRYCEVSGLEDFVRSVLTFKTIISTQSLEPVSELATRTLRSCVFSPGQRDAELRAGFLPISDFVIAHHRRPNCLRRRKLQLIKFLLSNTADPNAVDRYGNSIYMDFLILLFQEIFEGYLKDQIDFPLLCSVLEDFTVSQAKTPTALKLEFSHITQNGRAREKSGEPYEFFDRSSDMTLMLNARLMLDMLTKSIVVDPQKLFLDVQLTLRASYSALIRCSVTPAGIQHLFAPLKAWTKHRSKFGWDESQRLTFLEAFRSSMSQLFDLHANQSASIRGSKASKWLVPMPSNPST